MILHIRAHNALEAEARPMKQMYIRIGVQGLDTVKLTISKALPSSGFSVVEELCIDSLEYYLSCDEYKHSESFLLCKNCRLFYLHLHFPIVLPAVCVLSVGHCLHLHADCRARVERNDAHAFKGRHDDFLGHRLFVRLADDTDDTADVAMCNDSVGVFGKEIIALTLIRVLQGHEGTNVRVSADVSGE